MRISSLAEKIFPSMTLSLTAKAAEMRKKGLDVISLSSGELDFKPPKEVIIAAEEAMRAGKIKYTAASGMPELKEVLAQKYTDMYGTPISRNNIIVSAGAKQSLLNALLTVIEPGDDVLVPTPYWVSYPEMIKLARGKIILVPSKMSDEFKVNPDVISKYITDKTTAIMLNSPSNPTGSIYSRLELENIVNFLPEKIAIISDEIYEELVFEGEHYSLLSFGSEIFKKAIIISGVSKTYAMTGWRIGWAIGDPDIVAAMGRIQAHETSNPCTISQYATIAALSHCDFFCNQLGPIIKERRDFTLNLLKDIPEIKPFSPKGAFYIFCDIKGLLNNKVPTSLIFSKLLLEKALVATVPGEAFGAPGFLRISIAESKDRIAEAFTRIKKTIEREF